ncbi:DUF4340 domain-containing protein [Hugenholtzia roseola]|uniref:DUF4340 domain-containing protein n=1 Tax=Hugenholtzia roseola TaxID=1002 RepID=UPI0004278638|nr:DUF4340 domain-containing protein [Hugenholtzia roseola]
MTKIKLLSLVAVLLLVAIVLLWQTDSSSASKDEQSLTPDAFALSDTTALTRIAFGEELFFDKKAEGLWQVNNHYWADEEMFQSLLKVLQKMEIKRGVSASVSDAAANAYLKNGVTVRYFTQDKLLKSFAIWEYEGEAYAMFEGGDMYIVHLPGYYVPLHDIFKRKDYEWRDRSLLKTSANTFQSLEVQYFQKPEESFKINYTDFGYQVEGVAMLDTAFLFQYLPLFGNFEAEEYLYNDLLRDSVSQLTPFVSFTLADLNPTYSGKVSIYVPEKGNIYGIIERKQESVSPELVIFDYRRLEYYLAKRQDFIQK